MSAASYVGSRPPKGAREKHHGNKRKMLADMKKKARRAERKKRNKSTGEPHAD